MSKIICFLNQKGGVGKTTISFNLSYYLSEVLNKKVLIVDTDPQASIYSIFNKRAENDINTHMKFETLFTKQLNELNKFNNFDYIIVDTQGIASSEAVNVLKKLNAFFIVPTLSSFIDIESTKDVIEYLSSSNISFKLLLNGLHHSASAAELQSFLKEAKIDHFSNHLTYRNIYKISAGQGKSVLEEDKKFDEFINFSTEVVTWVNGGN
ncbi:AAA family ATPase [Rickettsiales bacterium LUAb2]